MRGYKATLEVLIPTEGYDDASLCLAKILSTIAVAEAARCDNGNFVAVEWVGDFQRVDLTIEDGEIYGS